MKLKRTRTFLELRVGDATVVDVVLYLRQADLEWFNTAKPPRPVADEPGDDQEEDAVPMDHSTDLFQVLEQSVLPRMLHREIEDSHYRRDPASKPPPLGPHGIPILAGEEDGKRQTANTSKKGAKRKRTNTKAKAAAKEALLEDEDAKSKPEKDVYYAFGKTLQLAYRCEDMGKTTAESFVFRDEKDAQDGNGILQGLDKLPKRIVAWVFPFDPSKPPEIDPTDGGFPLPERIPIAHNY